MTDVYGGNASGVELCQYGSLRGGSGPAVTGRHRRSGLRYVFSLFVARWIFACHGTGSWIAVCTWYCGMGVVHLGLQELMSAGRG